MQNNTQAQFEHEIIKKYRKNLWAKFCKAVKKYNLISPNDRIAVAISGGKDSLLLAKLLQEIKIHGDFDFDLEFISMDPGFNSENYDLLVNNAKLLGIDLKVFKSDVFEVSEKLAPENPCYICARMRRGFLYAKAKELNCNKLALGHHFDDVIETTMLNILYAGCFKTMVPKVDSKNFEGITLIRPMILIREKDISKIMKSNNITTMNCGCRVTSSNLPSKRREIKELIKNLDEVHPIISQNIYKSAENINIDATMGFMFEDEEFDFNKIYNKEFKIVDKEFDENDK